MENKNQSKDGVHKLLFYSTISVVQEYIGKMRLDYEIRQEVSFELV